MEPAATMGSSGSRARWVRRRSKTVPDSPRSSASAAWGQPPGRI
jgi:hypothetical protein